MNTSPIASFDRDGKSLSILSAAEQSGGPPKFTFDSVFPPDSQQVDVYDASARSIVEAVLEGFNGTVFAYGQTGSGKTYTMTGPNIDDEDQKGIIPRMINTVFEKIHSASDYLEFSVKVGYAEIYMEKVKDLLDPVKTNLKVHEDKARGVYIADLTEEYVGNETEIYELMKLGNDNREVGATLMNQQSSRSHSLFILTVTQSNTRDFSAKTGKLYLVDLAGSEKVSKTGAEGKRLDEAKTINKSLSTLGKVINALTDGKSTHIPYRDSKLTRVLQDSLGGNAKTALIITCSPSSFNEAETLSTLRFGIRAKSIKNKPKVNREYTVAELKLLLSKAEAEITHKNALIQELTGRLQAMGINPTDIQLLRTSFTSEKEEITVPFNLELEELTGEIDTVREQLEEERKNSEEFKRELEEMKEICGKLQGEKEQLRLEMQTSELKLGTVQGELKDKLVENVRLRHENIQFSHELLSLKQEKAVLETTISRQNSEISGFQSDLRNVANRVSSAKLLDDIESRDQIITELRAKSDVQEAVLHKIGSVTSDVRVLQTLQEYRKMDVGQAVAAQELLVQERERNQRLLEQVTELNAQVMMLVSGKMPDYQEVKKRIEMQVVAREQEKWENERKLLMKDLHNRVDKVVHLEIELDEFRESYSVLLASRALGDPHMHAALESIQKENAQLTTMYQELLHDKGDLEGSLTDLRHKCTRLQDRNLELEQKLASSLEELKLKTGKIDELERQLDGISRASVRSLSLAQHIRKRIKGGAKEISVDLTRSQPFEIQEEEEFKV